MFKYIFPLWWGAGVVWWNVMKWRRWVHTVALCTALNSIGHPKTIPDKSRDGMSPSKINGKNGVITVKRRPNVIGGQPSTFLILQPTAHTPMTSNAFDLDLITLCFCLWPCHWLLFSRNPYPTLSTWSFCKQELIRYLGDFSPEKLYASQCLGSFLCCWLQYLSLYPQCQLITLF